MSNNVPVVIVGSGSLALEICWIARDLNKIKQSFEIVGFYDPKPDEFDAPFGLRVFKSLQDIKAQFNAKYIVGIGNARTRQRVADELDSAGFEPVSIVHPTAVVGPEVKIGLGTLVQPYAVIAPFAEVGRHAVIHSNVSVGHHVKVGDFATLSPGARVGGYAELGEGVLLGMNASVIQKIKIAKWATVGANSLAVRNIKPSQVIIGVPGRVLK